MLFYIIKVKFHKIHRMYKAEVKVLGCLFSYYNNRISYLTCSAIKLFIVAIGHSYNVNNELHAQSFSKYVLSINLFFIVYILSNKCTCALLYKFWLSYYINLLCICTLFIYSLFFSLFLLFFFFVLVINSSHKMDM